MEEPKIISYRWTARDIADRYNVTDRHITNLAKAGDIPGVQVGSEWRFNADEVHEALVSRTRTIRKSPKSAGQ